MSMFQYGSQSLPGPVAVAVSLLLFCTTAHAQTGVSANAPEVSFYVGLGEACCGEDPHPVHGIATSDGGVVLVGKTAQPGEGWGGFAVKIGPPAPSQIGVVIDPAEDESFRWSVVMGQPNRRSVFLNAAEVDGAVFLAGGRSDAQGRTQMFLSKRSLSDGTLIWETQFGEEGAGAIEAVQPTQDGGLILAGITGAPQDGLEGFKSFGNPFGGQARLIYLSPDLVSGDDAPMAPSWQRIYPAYETVKAVHEVTDGDPGYILLVGREELAPTVVKTDLRGEPIWRQTYAGRFEATDLALHHRGGAHLGYTITGHGGEDGVLDGQLTRINLDGELVWATSFGDPEGGVGQFAGLGQGDPQLIFDECWGIQGLPDGGVIVGCGTGIEGCEEVRGETLRSVCRRDPRRTWRGWVVRFDVAGQLVWDRTDSFVEFGQEDEIADSASEFVILAPGGGFLSVVDQGFGIGLLALESESSDADPSAPNAEGDDTPRTPDEANPDSDPESIMSDSESMERVENPQNGGDADEAPETTRSASGCQTGPAQPLAPSGLYFLIMIAGAGYWRGRSRAWSVARL